MKKELILVAVTIVLLIAAAIAACRQTAGLSTPSIAPGEAGATAPPPELAAGSPTPLAAVTDAPPTPALTMTPSPSPVVIIPSPTVSGDAGSVLTVTPGATPGAAETPAVAAATLSYEEWRTIAFKYISEKYKVPLGELATADFFRRELLLTKVVLATGKVMWSKGGARGWIVAIDQGGRIYEEEGERQLEAAERAAHIAKYGKLDPRLYDALQTARPEDKFKVYVNVKGVDATKIWAALAAKYPEARLGKSGGATMQIPLELYEKVIYPEFRAELRRASEIAAKPVVDHLTGRGYAASVVAPAAVATELPKSVILEMEKRQDVHSISPIGKSVPLLDTAVPSAAAPGNWAAGRDASGRPVTRQGVSTGLRGSQSIEILLEKSEKTLENRRLDKPPPAYDIGG